MKKQAVLSGLSQFKILLQNPFVLLPILTIIVIVITLVVLPRFKKDKSSTSLDQSQINQILKNNSSPQDFAKLTREIGLQKAYELVKIKFPANDTGAHDFAHIIGIVAHETGGMANLKFCDTAYNYGCYHGFIEDFISKNTVSAVAQIEDGCIALGSVHAPSCLHGIGHGVMVDSSYNLNSALKNCASLQQTSQIYCWDGVFMERIVGSMQTPEDKVVMTKDTLREPCDSVSTTYKQQCWRNQVSAWLPFFTGNTKEVGKQCNLIEREYQKTCFESLGLLVTITTGQNHQALISACQVFPENQISDDCLIGAMKELLFEGKNPQIAATLCDAVSQTNRNTCQQIYADHLAQSQTRFGR